MLQKRLRIRSRINAGPVRTPSGPRRRVASGTHQTPAGRATGDSRGTERWVRREGEVELAPNLRRLFDTARRVAPSAIFHNSFFFDSWTRIRAQTLRHNCVTWRRIS